MHKNDIYAAVTQKIVASIESGGTAPWHRPWKLSGGYPISMSTGKRYRGINVLLLMLAGYSDPRWATYRKISEIGGQVRRGEKSTTVVFWKPIRAQENDDGEKVRDGYMLLKTFAVFNAQQVDGIAPLPEEEERPFTPIETAEAISRGYVWDLGTGTTGPNLIIGYDHAVYSPFRDEVHMPKPEQFESDEAYYATLFHELTHSTGHEKRLARIEPALFGTDPYAREELVAEIGASFLSGIAGLENAGGDQSAAYISGWLKAIKDDPSLVVVSAAQAQKAADLILGTTFDEELESAQREEVAA